MLTCDCDSGDDYAWYYEDTAPVTPLATRRMRRCCSCNDRIAIGDDCKAFARYRIVSDYRDPKVVVRIYGEGGEYPLATWYLCDRCAGLYESLDGLGFCGLLGKDLRESCREYAQMQRDGGVFKGRMILSPSHPC